MDVREKLVEQLREVASKTPPICRYDNPEEIEHFGKTITVYCKPFEQFQGLMRDAADYIAHGVTVQEWYSASNPPKEDGTYLVQTNTGTITTARFYAFKSFPATKYLPACHRSPSWQSNRNVVKWTFLPQPPKGE